MKDTLERSNTSPSCWPPPHDFGLPPPAAPEAARPTLVLALSAAGSPPTQSLLRARALANAAGGALHLMRVLPEVSHGASVLSGRNLTNILRSVEQTVESGGETYVDSKQAERLARLQRASGQLDVATRTVVRHDDDPVDAILIAAREEEADLVVVGTRRPAWFERRGPADGDGWLRVQPIRA